MKTLKILGHTYEVIEDKDWHDDTCHAKFCHPELIIRLDGKTKESVKQEALLHEIIEAINYHTELDLEHPKLMVLSEVLYMILSDNKMLKEVL